MAARDLSGAVDFGVLERYAAGDAVVMEEVLNLFRQQAEVWIDLLDPAGEGWRDAAHTIRGAAAGIGAERLASACALVEESSPELAAPAISRARDEMGYALADVAAFQHELMLRSLRGG